MSKKQRISGQVALQEAYFSKDHTPLREAWGVDLSDDLLCQALTHRSFANDNGGLPNNERLEFLGDAVLGVCVAEKLYTQFPDKAESSLSKMRASVVNEHALASLARELDLGRYILLSKGEILTDGANKDSILSDSVEAVLGALYLEKGFDYTRAVILRLLQSRIDTAIDTANTMDWKTVLQQELSQKKMGQPVFETVVSGPAHDQTFDSRLFVDGTKLGAGSGKTKKVAEHQAAQQAYNSVREQKN